MSASYLDAVRKFLLDNNVGVEDPDEYLEQLHGMMSGGSESSRGNVYDPNEPIPDPMTAYDKPIRSGTEETHDGYGFQKQQM